MRAFCLYMYFYQNWVPLGSYCGFLYQNTSWHTCAFFIACFPRQCMDSLHEIYIEDLPTSTGRFMTLFDPLRLRGSKSVMKRAMYGRHPYTDRYIAPPYSVKTGGKMPLPQVACHCHVPLVAMYTISRSHVYDSSGEYVQSLALTIWHRLSGVSPSFAH